MNKAIGQHVFDIWVNHVDGGWSPHDPFLRGSEEMVVKLARSLQAMHKIILRVFYTSKVPCGWELDGDTIYIDHKFFQPANKGTLLIVKDPDKLEEAGSYRYRQVVYYTNNVDDEQQLLHHDRYRNAKYVLAISQWHKDHLLSKIPNTVVWTHGSDVPNVISYQKEPFLCLYASSPDRGLHDLQRMWPSFQEVCPKLQLEVAYDGRSERDMDILYQRASFLLYPCHGNELLCLTAIKAQQRGVYCLTSNHMVLPEVVQNGQTFSLGDYQQEVAAFFRSYVNDPTVLGILSTDMTWPTWKQQTKKLLEFL